MSENIEVTIEITCPECNGEGFNEWGPECSKPASMCCGGCYKTIECDKCSSGEASITLDHSDVQDLIEWVMSGDMEEAKSKIMRKIG